MNETPWTAVVVDDAREVRLLVKRQLGVSGRFTVVGEGSDGREAIELARTFRPEVLLLDISMPEMDGLEALPHIRNASPETVVVMYTGFDERGLAAQARALGAAALIEKSVDIADLPRQLDAIRRATPPQPGVTPVRPEPEPDPHTGVLDEHLERFREIFDEAAIGMATLTLTGTIVRSNRALAGLIGSEIGALVGAHYASFATDGAKAAVRAGLEAAQRGERDLVQFEHSVTIGSDQRWLLANLAPVKDSRGRPLYLFMQVQDVSAQRAAEEKLRQSEERFRLLVEAVEDYAIFMLDPGGQIVSWNAGAQRIKGYSADEIIGRHFRVFYPPEVQASKHPEHELELALRDGHYEEEGWRVRRDGSRFWASVVITAVHTKEDVHIGFTKVTRDMDERRRMQLDLESAAAALAAANESLEAANVRLAQEAADQAQFLAVTAHELRSPVGVLSGSANLLAEHWSDMTAEERGDLFESVRLGSARLQRLLNDLLMASRLGSKRIRPVLEEVELAAVLSTSVAAARAKTPAAEILVDGELGALVLGEPDRLGQIFDNLLTNALRHGRPPVSVRIERVAGRVEVRVSDGGPGVDPAVRDRLFQRFATGGTRGGTGLGLFIVRELALAYGGDAWYSEDGASSGAFVVSLLAASVPPTGPSSG